MLEAEAAPALAEAARNLGMIPSQDTAHLVQDPTGNWIVVGKPKPAEGAPPPPLNTKLPDEVPPARRAAPPAAAAPKPGSRRAHPCVSPTPLTPPVPGAVSAAAGVPDPSRPAPVPPGARLARVPRCPGLALAPRRLLGAAAGTLACRARCAARRRPR